VDKGRGNTMGQKEGQNKICCLQNVHVLNGTIDHDSQAHREHA